MIGNGAKLYVKEYESDGNPLRNIQILARKQ